MKFRPWLQGAGLAMLYLLPLLALYLAPGQDAFYHQVIPITSLTRGALIDLLVLGAVTGVGLTWLNRMGSLRFARVLWIPVMVVTAWVTERGVSEFFRNVNAGFSVPAWAMHLHWIVLTAAALLFLFMRRMYNVAVKLTELFLASAGIAALFVALPQLVYACFNHAPPEQAFFSHPVRQPWHPGERRVVWLLFDELSYRQALEYPQPGIHLPAFARLKQESVSFSRLVPPGNLTQIVVPSLLLGQPVSEIKSNRKGELLWRSGSQTNWNRFDAGSTIFASARRLGWGTGVVGWYNPYCRLLATTLNECYWDYQEMAGGSRFSRLSSSRSMLENAGNALPLVPQVENAFEHVASSQTEAHRDDYKRLLKHAKSLIADTNIRFAFIHLPVPHPPGIYPDPLDNGHEDYLGNLLLADQALAELRAAIQATAAAPDTILIASSDHSWRIPIWRNGRGWTQAEERATSYGQFDTRPVLLVHFPGQTKQTAKSVDKPVNAIVVHSLLLDMLTGKISKPEDIIDAMQAEPEVAAGS